MRVITEYGGMLFNERGEVLIREVANKYAGYVWSFAKGKADPGESPEAAAIREVFEETGYRCRVIGEIPGEYRATGGWAKYYLMRPEGEQEKFSWETRSTEWVSIERARELIALTEHAVGRKRDNDVLSAALLAASNLSTAQASNGT